MVRSRFICLLALCAPLADAAIGRAANWASNVVDYSAGATYAPSDLPAAGAANASYTSVAPGATAILDGLPADVGMGTPYSSVLTPFNAAYQPADILGMGQGGSITLQFATPVRTNGYTIGVHTASGLYDSDYPNGSAGATATPYTTPRRATIGVSADNFHWISLGTFDLDNPSNYYATGVDTPGYQLSVTGGTPADVERPFVGSLSGFGGKDWPQILAMLDGSAGGNWVDLSSTGLPSVSYIRFTVPAGSVLYLDGVVGLPVPEPASLALLALGAIGLTFRRRKNLS